MRRYNLWGLAAILAAGWAGFAWGADEPETPKGEDPAANELKDAAEASDPAFDKFVDMAALRAAYGKLDSAGMTDGALQLAEGERVLRRAHKGVKAADVLEAALRLASQNGDKVSLERIARFAQASNNQALSARVAGLLQLAAVPRAAAPELALGAITEADGQIVEAVKRELDLAKLDGGAAKVDEIMAFVKAARQDELLTADSEAGLLKYLAEVQKGMGAAPARADLNSALAALSSPSRAGGTAPPGTVVGLDIPSAGPAPKVGFFYNCNNQKYRLLRITTTNTAWNKTALGAKAVAAARAASGDSYPPWNDQWYKRTMAAGEVLIMIAHNTTTGSVSWAAVKNNPTNWAVIGGDGSTKTLGNGDTYKRSTKLNGWPIDFDIKNPPNSGGYTGNDILYGFGY